MQLRKFFSLLLFSLAMIPVVYPQSPEGELRRWHKITLTFDGPSSSETANPNPFTDFRLDVQFTHVQTGLSYLVPGYYAACGDAAESSCKDGNKWRVHLSPDLPGIWSWSASFKKGTDIALSTGGDTGGFFDGAAGEFTIQESDKSGRDHRSAGKGRLRYVNKHYLRYTGTDPASPNGDWFIKGGADAPENMMSYEDFDDVPDAKKDWQPHQQDYLASDAESYTWQGGKGSEMLGAIRYLSDIKQVNAFSFLTFSLDGDDKTIGMYIASSGDGKGWDKVHHDRFDVSRLDQWERIFSYADKKGMFLHFKTQETENDHKMDGGNVGRERKLYYRELIARYSHHLALNWNLGEENTQSGAQRRDMAQFFHDHDPYRHLVVLHTYPGQQDQVYGPMLGDGSELTGVSIQTGITGVHNEVTEWVKKSRDAGQPWVVANDEQGGAQIGVHVDPNDNKKVREEVIWGTLLGGGCGFEFYYGYQSGCSDLNCEDHRTRDQKYSYAAHAIKFFEQYFMPYLPEVVNEDGEIGDNDAYLLRSEDKKAYAIYLPDGGSTSISGLPGQDNQISWFNPRTGEMGSTSTLSGNDISAPDNNDWVAFILTDGGTINPPPPPPTNGLVLEEENGVLAIEAEHFLAQTKTDKRKWYHTDTQTTPGITPDPDPNHAASASGGAYVEILPDTRVTHSDPIVGGVSFSNNPGEMVVIDYQIYINDPGRYYVWVRAYSTGTEDNGVHVGLDGNWPSSGERMQWCNGKNEWTWESKQRTDANHCGEPEKIYLDISSPGLHTLSFSMREDGFEMDKIVLNKVYTKPQGAGPPEKVRGTVNFPVEWLDFRAKQRALTEVELDWATASEWNNAEFQIERSVDRVSFEKIGQIRAAGNSSTTQFYSFIDANAAFPELYYRIKQVDIDGAYSYSEVREIRMQDSFAPQIFLYPNPASELLQVRVDAEGDKIYDLKLVDMQGRTLYQTAYESQQGEAKINIEDYAPGIYLIVLTQATENQIVSSYFLKQ